MGGSVYVAPGAAPFHHRGTVLRVHTNAPYPRQIDNQAAIACAEPRSAVATAAHGYQKLVFARATDRVNNVPYVGALNNRQGPSIDIGIVHAARGFIFRILRPNHPAFDRT
jgi:hypothetical protein